jgi:hypothetical protein
MIPYYGRHSCKMFIRGKAYQIRLQTVDALVVHGIHIPHGRVHGKDGQFKRQSPISIKKLREMLKYVTHNDM